MTGKTYLIVGIHFNFLDKLQPVHNHFLITIQHSHSGQTEQKDILHYITNVLKSWLQVLVV